jgi:hypothetical protein
MGLKEHVANHPKGPEKPQGKRSKRSVGINRKKATITIPIEDYLALLNIGRKLLGFLEQRNDPMAIEQERIEQETIERGHHQPGLGWTYMNHFVPVVSEDWTRKHERRKEIIRKGTWNPSMKGWEYDGDFAGIWD